MSIGISFLESALKRVSYYKSLGDNTFEQLEDQDFHYVPETDAGSIAVIMQHITGNMLSRWTTFLDTDGEKPWRNRDAEFEDQQLSKQQLLDQWRKGWNCLFDTWHTLQEDDLLKTITIRNEPLPVIDAIIRQLAHYPYHIGQIIYLAKLIKKENWKNLSIPVGGSVQYNQQLMSGKKQGG